MSFYAQPEGALRASAPRNLLINGEWRPAASGKTFDVEDSATGKVLPSIADAGPKDGMAALDAAAAAQESRAKVRPLTAFIIERASYQGRGPSFR